MVFRRSESLRNRSFQSVSEMTRQSWQDRRMMQETNTTHSISLCFMGGRYDSKNKQMDWPLFGSSVLILCNMCSTNVLWWWWWRWWDVDLLQILLSLICPLLIPVLISFDRSTGMPWFHQRIAPMNKKDTAKEEQFITRKKRQLCRMCSWIICCRVLVLLTYSGRLFYKAPVVKFCCHTVGY